MWTRREVKENGRTGMNRNYWKTVLVSLITGLLLSGGAAGASSGGIGQRVTYYAHGAQSQGGGPAADTGNAASSLPAGALIGIALFLTLVILAAAAAAIAFSAFVVNPIEVGARRFFVQNLSRPAEIREMGRAFDRGYMNAVKVMFFRDLYTVLWCLLFIIPGIVKSYEYRMIPYLLTEYPEMPRGEAFARSRALMNGQKWKTFVLDLSFIGWDILSLMSLGLLGLFYVGPYKNMTDAALYEALSLGTAAGEGGERTGI